MIKEIYELVEQAKKENEKIGIAYKKAVEVCRRVESRGGFVIGRHGDGFLMFEVKRLDGPPQRTPEGVPVIEKKEPVFGWLPTLLKTAELKNEDLFEELVGLDLEIFRVRTPKLTSIRQKGASLFAQWLEEQISDRGTK